MRKFLVAIASIVFAVSCSKNIEVEKPSGFLSDSLFLFYYDCKTLNEEDNKTARIGVLRDSLNCLVIEINDPDNYLQLWTALEGLEYTWEVNSSEPETKWNLMVEADSIPITIKKDYKLVNVKKVKYHYGYPIEYTDSEKRYYNDTIVENKIPILIRSKKFKNIYYLANNPTINILENNDTIKFTCYGGSKFILGEIIEKNDFEFMLIHDSKKFAEKVKELRTTTNQKNKENEKN
jgi:hypothetical protein